jgi:homoserine O-succinyltransferase/O-acetyltransferase
MPVVMEQGASGGSFSLLQGVRCVPHREWLRGDGIAIGIVNNMPDAALEATERQFISLLATASERRPVRVRLFALPQIPRGESAQRYLATSYADIGELWNADFDALIVTGTEPLRDALQQEPYWPIFTGMIDWAARNTRSTIWSCLAAHAAVLHLDGIPRRPLAEKCFGVFQCDKTAGHALTAAAPAQFVVPHSRWNGVAEDALTDCGYEVLSRSDEIGADIFLKESGSLFVFLQGHPEYDASTPLREFRRDVARFLRGERETFPAQPQRYFDQPSEQALEAFRIRAFADRSPDLMESFPPTAMREPLIGAWRTSAVRLYRNWLSCLAGRRETRVVMATPELARQ